MIKDLNRLTVAEFLEELASSKPVPGGGSVAALAGALAAALTTMVARLTLAKEKFRDRHPLMAAVEKKAEKHRAAFQVLMQQDTEAYQAVVESIRLPRNTEEERDRRDAAMQHAFREAARVPLETLLTLDRMMEDALEAVQSGNPSAVSDAGAAVQMISAAARIAAYNVWINLSSIQDVAFRKDVEQKVQAALDRVQARAAQCHDELRRTL
ncbi:MAG: cyclodeaminase/cyclohydrolase family protein [Desulfosoma sp.]